MLKATLFPILMIRWCNIDSARTYPRSRWSVPQPTVSNRSKIGVERPNLRVNLPVIRGMTPRVHLSMSTMLRRQLLAILACRRAPTQVRWRTETRLEARKKEQDSEAHRGPQTMFKNTSIVTKAKSIDWTMTPRRLRSPVESRRTSRRSHLGSRWISK